jgi:uncharacterized membrane protein
MRPKNWFDRCIKTNLIERLEKIHIYYDTSTVRWGFVGISVTIFLSVIAIFLALFTLKDTIWQGFLVIGWVILGLDVLFIIFVILITIYFIRNQIIEEPMKKS